MEKKTAKWKPQLSDFTAKTCRKKRVGAAIIPWQSGDVNDYERIARVIRFLD